MRLMQTLNVVPGTGVTVYSVHPGYVQTELGRHMVQDLSHVSQQGQDLMKELLATISPITPKQGSQTTLYCVIAPELEKESGKYYA